MKGFISSNEDIFISQSYKTEKKKQTKEFHPLSDEAASEISCICNNVSAVYMQHGRWGRNLKNGVEMCKSQF